MHSRLGRAPTATTTKPQSIPSCGSPPGTMVGLDDPWPILPSPSTCKIEKASGPVLTPSTMSAATTSQAPQLPVQELGLVLPKLFAFLHEVPADEHFLFSKIDLSDGFWCMVVSTEVTWNFCFVLPDQPRIATCLVVPSSLQMGWGEAPYTSVQPPRQQEILGSHCLAARSPYPHIHWNRSSSLFPSQSQSMGDPTGHGLGFTWTILFWRWPRTKDPDILNALPKPGFGASTLSSHLWL